jgi:hypothetical protein
MKKWEKIGWPLVTDEMKSGVAHMKKLDEERIDQHEEIE